ncbi:MAG: type II toxin-antitoxin system RelE/ParE family toxin [Bacteroidetes bacterium]|nr:type II toxin-antitoxin system RelE/ParE family toxin [Bacteroidota bacterium]
MDKRKPEIIFKKKAIISINNVSAHIHEKGYPEIAEKFADKMYQFGHSLNNFPGKYPICKQPQLASRKMRCAVFNKTYIFVYKLVENKLIIYNIIHGKRGTEYFSA